MQNVSLEAIKIDGGTQPRAKIDTDTVSEYAEHYRNKVDLPELVVYFDGKEHWLADGFHRYHGAREAGRTSVACAVIKGTQRDAILYSCGANDKHGLKRTNADKRHAVEVLLADAEWRQKSDRWIAEKCHVGHPLVADLRRRLEEIPVAAASEGEEVAEGKDGRKLRRSSGKRSASQKKRREQEAAAAVVQATSDEEDEPEVELTTADKCDSDNKAIESFCRSLVKFFEDNVPKVAWTEVEGRIDSALSAVRAGCNTLRTAKAVVCPQCEDGEDAKGSACRFCAGHGYLPKLKADQAAGVKV